MTHFSLITSTLFCSLLKYGMAFHNFHLNFTSVINDGYFSLFVESMFSGGWKDVWVVLYDNSDLCMYNRQGDLEIKAKIHMKVKKKFHNFISI